MEFERRPRTHWPLVVLYLIYVCGVVYLLMANNRFLYSHIELRVALAGEQVETITPIPSAGQQPPVGELGDATFWQQANPERSGQDSSPQARDRDYVPEWQKVVVEDGREARGLLMER
ncbi:MAG: hypothetical protein IPK68_22440 [Bdellovibrionales bacterium]|nr:hypothetical protein [Bdellovibrionales bacterium]